MTSLYMVLLSLTIIVNASDDTQWLDQIIDVVNSDTELTEYTDCLLDKSKCLSDGQMMKGKYLNKIYFYIYLKFF